MRKNLKNIAISAALVASPFLMAQGAQAESKTAGVKASIEETLSLTLSANAMDFELETSDLYTNSINVTGRTNSANGYTISFNANNDYNDLKHSNSLVEALIPSITSPRDESSFPEKSWGYSVDDSDYAFKKVPLEPKNIFATSEQGQNTHKFTAGIKGSADLVAGDYENELLFTIVANPIVEDASGSGIDIDNIDSDDIETIYDDKAKAILGANGNLNFVYNEDTYTVGSTYTDNLGETTIAAVYQVPVNGSRNYLGNSSDRPDITSVNFTDSFYNFHPLSTKNWFRSLRYLQTITNPQNLNMSEVISVQDMFDSAGYYAENFTLDLRSWDMSKVRNLTRMFYCAGSESINVDINLDGWDISSAKTAENIFTSAAYNAPYITLNLNDWDASSLTGSLERAFQSIGYNRYTSHPENDSTLNLNMRNFYAPNVSDVEYMFLSAGWTIKTTNFDLSGLNMKNITDVSHMFEQAGQYSEDVNMNLTNFNLSNAVNLSSMLMQVGYGAERLSVDVTGWKLGRAEDMSSMLKNMMDCQNKLNSSIELQHESLELKGLETWDVSTVTNMSQMFENIGYFAKNLDISLDLSSWDVGNVTNVYYMFEEFGRKANSLSIDLHGWNTSSLKDASYMFNNCGGNVAEIAIVDLSNWDVDEVEDMSRMFSGFAYESPAVSLNLDGWEVNPSANMQYMFSAVSWRSGWTPPSWYQSN